MANRRFTSERLYNFHKKPVLLTAKFTVLSTNAAGCTGFAAPGAGGFGMPNSANTTFGQGINQIYCYSSAAAAANYCTTGIIAVQLQDNYTACVGAKATLAGPVTGSAILVSTGFTAGSLYQITTLGSSTTANWQAVGVPAGVTPVVGMVFQASTSSAGTGSGGAKALASSNLTSIELAGDPNSTLQPVGQANGFSGGSGGWLYFQCFKTATLTQPTDGTIVWLNLWLLGQ